MKSTWASIAGLAVAVVAAASSMASAQAPGVTDTTIKVGVISEFSVAGQMGRGVRDAGRLVFDRVNAEGGVHGRKIEMVIGDSACQPSPMVSELKRVIEREKVFALFGSGCSGSAVAAIPIVDKEQIPWMTTSTSHYSLVKPLKKSIFRLGAARADLTAKAMVDYGVKELKADRFGVVNMTMEYGAATAQFNIEHLKAAHNKTPVAHEVFNLGDVDFTAQLVRLKDKKPDVTLVCAFPKEAAILFRQATEVGFKTKWIGCSGIATRDFPALVKEAGAGTVVSYENEYLIESDHPDMVAFRKAFDDKYPNHPPSVPDVYESFAYAGAQVFVEGLRRAGRNLTRPGFITALESIKNFKPAAWMPVTLSDRSHEGNTVIRFAVIQPDGTRRLVDYRYEIKE